MRHASRELIHAMIGIQYSVLSRACDNSFGGGEEYRDGNPERTVWAFMGHTLGGEAFEDVLEVTCPDCLRLMSDARGQRRTEELLVWQDRQMEMTQ